MSRSSLDLIVQYAVQRAGIEKGRCAPPLLRKAFESALREDTSDGRKLDVKTKEFLMGHVLTGSQDNYYDRVKVDWLRQEYSKVCFFPELESKVDMTSQLKGEILFSVAGYSEEEIDKLGLVTLPDDQYKAEVREKLMGAIANSGTRQTVVPFTEAKGTLADAWEFVAMLPNSRQY